jgi:hypothetical protein
MEPKRRLRDMTDEELGRMTPEEMFATFDLQKIFLREDGYPLSSKSFGRRVYERWRGRFLHLRRPPEADAQG